MHETGVARLTPEPLGLGRCRTGRGLPRPVRLQWADFRAGRPGRITPLATIAAPPGVIDRCAEPHRSRDDQPLEPVVQAVMPGESTRCNSPPA